MLLFFSFSLFANQLYTFSQFPKFEFFAFNASSDLIWLSFSNKKSRFERMTCFNKDTLFRFVFQIQQTALSVVI